MLKCRQNWTVYSAYTKWTSNARLTSDTVFDAGSPINMIPMIGDGE